MKILCFNCDQPVDRPVLFCSQVCTQEAELVRNVSRWRSEGRDAESDIRRTITIKLAHILNGGYPRWERELSTRLRQQITERDKGICQICGIKPGIEIDHIVGSSREPANLQLLCRDCHLSKTERSLKKLTPAHPHYAEFRATIKRLEARFVSETPVRPCDDYQVWKTVWQKHQTDRKIAFQKLDS